MKQSKTVLKELTAAYRAVLRHGILCNAIALGLVAMPALAGAPNTSGVAWVFGDVVIPAGQPIDNMAFGGRRMSAHGQDGKYRNDFPDYRLEGRSFEVLGGDAYVGPVTLTLRELTDADTPKYNYQWNDGNGDIETDIDLAEWAGIEWGDDQATVYGKLAAKINTPGNYDNAYDTTGGVLLFAQRDSSKEAGLLKFTDTDAVIDGATVNATNIEVNGGSMTFVKQDPSSLSGATRWYTNAENISSDGITTLNADTINIDGSLVRVNADAELTMMANNIVITGESTASEEDQYNPSRYLVRADGENSVLNIGTAEHPVDSIDIRHTGYDARAFTLWEDTEANIYGKSINIEGYSYGVTAWPTLGETSATLNIVGDDINIASSNGHGMLSEEGADVSVRGKTVAFSGGVDALQASDSGTIHVIADNLTVAGYDGILANYKKGQITIETTGDVNVTAEDSAIHAGFGTADVTKAKADTSFVDIRAKNINLTATETGIEAMSNGWIDLDGNLTVNAKNAILARGYATVNVNESRENTVKLNGDVNFNFYSNPGSSGNSGSVIDAYVNVNLANAQSYWTGNTVVDYLYGTRPEDRYLEVNNFNLSLSNGAVWNATKITDTNETIIDEETQAERTTGKYYTALNNLNINEGTVNIADTTRGIVVENATIADATFNGGDLNIGAMTLTSGTNTFNNNVKGVDAASVLTVNSGATMNIGTNNVDVNTIALNGDMLATLREGDAQITAGTFTGNGTLKLTMAQAGTYKVFGDKSFANIAWDESGLTTSSPIYNLTWNGGDVTATRKTAAQVAEDNNLTEESGSFVSNLTDSSSDKLKELSVALQEKLAAGDTESVEHATRAVHPEKESVVQSVSTSVQNTVVNLASSRMVMPTAGRAGGDVKLTSGGMWVQGLYNKSKHADAFSGYTRGIAAGLDGTLNKVWTIGAGYSFAHSNIGGTARDTEIDSNTFFMYGQYKPSNWYLNAVANYTWSDYSEKGTILDNMPIFADYNVDSFGGNIATGYDFDNGITPELGLRYIHVSADDYTNSYGVKTHLDDSDYMTGILGARYTFNIVANKYTTFMPQLHAAAKYDLLSDKNVATVTMPGINSYVMDNERLNRFGGEFGIGLGVKYGNLDMSLNYDIDVRKDYTSQTGMLKFRANF